MNTKRIKEIQAGTAYPNSRSVCSALMQVWNECCHEQAPADTGILALDRHCTDETAAPVEDEPRNGDEWPKWYMHKSVDTLICFKDAGAYGEVMIEQGHMYAHPVSVGRLWPEFMSNISSGYLPICPAAAYLYVPTQHQHETAPAESGIHADGLTVEGR